MPITIKGAELRTISLELEPQQEPKISATYALVGSNNRVLAKQSLNGYSDLKLEPSPEARKALGDFVAAYQNDLTALLGLTD